ncbi:sodium/glucose cotransporter 4-like isoform X6 [Tachypleus tridentatus]|uniref:sodium/glucose cotransporter 4-like isoform X6 n=1 Tax=Tachypleus tridentatus TaxID=6853 RepID=UPI003FD1C017
MAVDEAVLHWGDVLVIVCYFVGILSVGLWSSKLSKRDSISGYFLASRNMHWILVGASLFSSNVSSGHFVGLAGSGASSGIAIAGFELNAMFVMLILGWIFVPVYTAAGVYTMPEYLRKRFGGQRIRIYMSVLSLLLYIFTKISADLYAGAIFIEQSMDWNLYLSVTVLLAVAGIFTVTGGLTAVMWTDLVQTVLMIVGAFALMVMSFIKVGGYHELLEQFGTKMPSDSSIGYNSDNKSCSSVPDNYMHLLRSADDPELPWTGMTFGLTISAVWCWCTDQVIVQRTLSARNLSHAKAGCILAGYLKFFPLFLIVFPGMASRVLFTDEIGCSNPEVCKAVCSNEAGCTNIAYPLLVLKLMPPGARGLMLSVMLAALMSSLTSIFNSSSTIFTIDIWTRIRKQATEMELLIVGRYTEGAFFGLVAGLVVGIIRFVLEFYYTVPPCADGQPDPRPAVLAKVHYLHFGCILFIISCIVTTVISLLTKPIDKKQLYRLTFWTRLSSNVREELVSHRKEASRKNVSNDVTIAKEGRTNLALSSETLNDSTQANVKKHKEENIGDPQKSPEHLKAELPTWKRVLFFIFGINKNPSSQMDQKTSSVSPHEEIQQVLRFVNEERKWKKWCNINAILLAIFGGFVWGYYA